MKPNLKNNIGQIPFQATLGPANASRNKRLIQAMAVCFAMLATALNSMATLCVLTAYDGSGQDSFRLAQVGVQT